MMSAIALAQACALLSGAVRADDFDPSPWGRSPEPAAPKLVPPKPSEFGKVAQLHTELPVYANGDDRELLAAAARNDYAAAEGFIRGGANVNARDEGGMRPLIFALDNGSIEMVRLLLESGADPDVKIHGSTVLATAALNGYTRIAELLLQAGARVDDRNDNDYTPLMKAAYMNQLGAIKVLLRYHPDLSLQDETGMTALSIAQAKGHADIVDLLLKQGAKPATAIPAVQPVGAGFAANSLSSTWTFQE